MPRNTNPFISMEDNTIDPNENNPVLKAEDPAKAVEEDGQEVADNFEYVEAEATEGEKQKQDDAILEDDVQLKITEIDNIVKDSDAKVEVIQAMASVATEMYAIIAEQGKLSTADLMIAHGAMASFESAWSELKETESQIPSMESYKNETLQYTYSLVSLEAVDGKFNRAVDNSALSLVNVILKSKGLITPLTPLITRAISRANRVNGMIDGAHRDAGQKEVSGGFIKRLVVEGRHPDAKTVVKTSAYLEQITRELLSPKSSLAITDILGRVNEQLSKAMTTGNFSEYSLLQSAALYVPVAGVVTHNKKHDEYSEKLKVDPSALVPLFKLYPSVCKISQTSESDALEERRSLPLFGNCSVVVGQYKPVKAVSLSKQKPFVHFEKSGQNAEGTTIQVLTANESKAVIKNCIAILTALQDYYKLYNDRTNRLLTEFKKTQQLMSQADKIDNKSNITKAHVHAITQFYVRNQYWEIADGINDFAGYLRKTVGALIDLVEQSARLARGGSPSQESIDLTEQANPFLK